MRDFSYERAETWNQAVSALTRGAHLVAGGTEFLNWQRLGITHADSVSDITRIPGLRDIAVEKGQVRIGALCTLSDIEASEIVRENAPVLSRSCLKAASAQLRNRASIGGNVLQKTRCPYFRAEAATERRMPWPCNKRVPGSGCAALDRPYARAALFGWTQACMANQPSDPAVALAALDAIVDVQGPNGSREIPMADFHLTQHQAAGLVGTEEATAILGRRLPDVTGAEAILENRLHADEMIVGYRFPVDLASRTSAYLKVRERESYEYAMTSAAVCLDLDGDRIRTARIALGSIAQKPWRLSGAEDALAGVALDKAVIVPILSKALEQAKAPLGLEFKIKLARNTAWRAMQLAVGQAHD